MFVFKFVWNVFGDKQTPQVSAIPVALIKKILRTWEKFYKDDLKNISGGLGLLHYCKDEAKNHHGDSPEMIHNPLSALSVLGQNKGGPKGGALRDRHRPDFTWLLLFLSAFSHCIIFPNTALCCICVALGFFWGFTFNGLSRQNKGQTFWTQMSMFLC